MEERGGARKRQHWLNEDYSIFSWDVPAGAPYEGKSIQELDWGRRDAVYVVKVRHGDKKIPMPPARTVLHAGDHVHVIGDRMSLETFYKTLGIDQDVHMRTLKEFLSEDYSAYYAEAPEGIAVNTVGAGDSMTAAFAASRIEGHTLCDSFKFAVAAGSACAFKEGFPSGEEISAMMGRVKLIDIPYV
jgi:hypothetical protein